MPAHSLPPAPRLLAVAALCGATLVGACREPTSVGPDLATGPLKMRWAKNPGMPLGEGRAGLPLVHSTADRRLIGFGGSPTTQADTWVFSLANDAWTTLVMGAVPPPGRVGHCAVFLPAQNQVLYVGGHDDGATAARPPMLLSVGTPGFLDVGGAGPSPSSGCTAAWFARKDRAVLFGGQSAAGTPSAETWLYDPAAGAFGLAQPADAPSPRTGARLVVDPGPGGELTSGRLLLFGGAGEIEGADVWVFDGDRWGQVGTSGDPAASTTDAPRPLGRSGAAVAVDPSRRLLYVFGGERQGVLLADLWRLHLATLTWERVDVDGGPTGRADASVAWDAILDRMLVFGGRGSAGPLADGWTLSVAP